MIGYSPEQQARVDELMAHKREIDLRAITLCHEVRQVMLATGEPLRGDYPSRGDYRAAHSRWRKARA